jgi:hypothetical protein
MWQAGAVRAGGGWVLTGLVALECAALDGLAPWSAR